MSDSARAASIRGAGAAFALAMALVSSITCTACGGEAVPSQTAQHNQLLADLLGVEADVGATISATTDYQLAVTRAPEKIPAASRLAAATAALRAEEGKLRASQARDMAERGDIPEALNALAGARSLARDAARSLQDAFDELREHPEAQRALQGELDKIRAARKAGSRDPE